MQETTAALESILETARVAALEAGKAILEVYETPDFGIEQKADDSPLTKADKAAHDILVKHLLPTGLPILSEEGADIPYAERVLWDWYWLLDPLDGTKEFIKRNGEFTVNIALMHHGIPVGGVVYAPYLGSLYVGSKKTGVYKEEKNSTIQLSPLPEKQKLERLLERPTVRVIASRTHRTSETDAFISRFNQVELLSMGSSLKFMLMAEQKADFYPRFAPTMEWDTAAAHAILNALNWGIFKTDLSSELTYNKPSLLNPSFLAF